MMTAHCGLSTSRDKEQLWEVIEEGMGAVFRQESSQHYHQYLYRAGYELLQLKQVQFVYENLKRVVSARVTAQKNEILQAVDVLPALRHHWKLQQTANLRTHQILSQMDRSADAAVTLYVGSSAPHPLMVMKLGDTLFKEHVVLDNEIQQRLQKSFLDMVHRLRAGDNTVQVTEMKTISDMLMALGKSDAFEPVLEAPFIEATTGFYIDYARKHIGQVTVKEYIMQFQEAVKNERTWVADCVGADTVSKVMDVLGNVFVVSHMEHLLGEHGCVGMLRQWQLDDLKLLYDGFKHPKREKEVIQRTCVFFFEDGHVALSVEHVANDPLKFVETLLTIHDRLMSLVTRVFSPSAAIDRDIEKTVLETMDNIMKDQPNCARFLSLRIHHELVGNKEDSEVQQAAESVMTVVQHLRDKDLFEMAYQNHLSNRILTGAQLQNDVQERHVLSIIKQKCGAQFTSKMEGMFGDMDKSERLMESFRAASQGQEVEKKLHVKVLTSAFWMLPPPPKVVLPDMLAGFVSAFEQFYVSQHQGRKMTFYCDQGTVELAFHHAGKKMELTTGTPYALLLLQFQGDDWLSVEGIAARLGLEVEHAVKYAGVLCPQSPSAPRLLRREQRAEVPGGPEVVCYQFNADFRTKTMKFKMGISKVHVGRVPPGQEAPVAAIPEPSESAIENDRIHVLDAAIVRLMKSRRTLKHDELVNQTILQLQPRFLPNSRQIKGRIDHLIDVGYMQRSEGALDVYEYKA